MLHFRQDSVRRRAALRLEALEVRDNPSHTITVDDDRAQKHNADFTSIQAALMAAQAGDSIRVYPGTYHEQIVISSKLDYLKLEAVGPTDSVKIAPNLFTDPTEAIVRITGAKNVSIRGFLISGEAAPTTPGGGANYGVLVDGGGSAEIEHNHIATIRDLPITGIQEGIGIQFGLTDGAGTVLSTGRGEAEHNLINDYQKGGIVVIGTGSNAEVEHNTILGVGPTAVIGQNGIQISDGAGAEVEHNIVAGNNFTGGGVSAAGILIFQTSHVEVEHNTVSGNNNGIFLASATNCEIEHNDSSTNTLDGIAVLNSSNNRIAHNVVRTNFGDGIHLDSSNNNRIEDNRAIANFRFGIELEITATGNSVRGNHLINNLLGNLLVANPDNDVGRNHFKQ